jgi:hypothetical protein
MVIFNPFITRTFGPVLLFSIVTFAAVIMTQKPGILKNLVLYAGFFYFLNNLAGDAYLLYKKSGNFSYKKLVERIDEKVPDNTTVASIQQFWYAFPRNEFYSSYTHWKFKNYKNLEDLIQSKNLDYIVLSDYLIRGFTATSERKEEVAQDDLIWYNSITAYVNQYALLVYEFDAMNYGMVRIWKVIK